MLEVEPSSLMEFGLICNYTALRFAARLTTSKRDIQYPPVALLPIRLQRAISIFLMNTVYCDFAGNRTLIVGFFVQLEQVVCY